jgi:hypothetical protein
VGVVAQDLGSRFRVSFSAAATENTVTQFSSHCRTKKWSEGRPLFHPRKLVETALKSLRRLGPCPDVTHGTTPGFSGAMYPVTQAVDVANTGQFHRMKETHRRFVVRKSVVCMEIYFFVSRVGKSFLEFRHKCDSNTNWLRPCQRQPSSICTRTHTHMPSRTPERITTSRA